MNSKLTLSIDQDVIDRAKKYAQKQGVSLSKMVENLLNTASASEKSNTDAMEISPFIKSLSINLRHRTKKEIREEYGKHLEEKYK